MERASGVVIRHCSVLQCGRETDDSLHRMVACAIWIFPCLQHDFFFFLSIFLQYRGGVLFQFVAVRILALIAFTFYP